MEKKVRNRDQKEVMVATLATGLSKEENVE